MPTRAAPPLAEQTQALSDLHPVKEASMLRKVVLGSLAALALMIVPAAAQAQFSQGDWVLTLGGSGSSDNDFIDNDFEFDGSLSYFVSDQIGVGVRQGVSFNDVEGSDDDWNASTVVFADFHFNLGRWQPFIGAEIGYLYGDNVDDTWIAGPEGGVKYFVNSTTFIYGMVEYQFFFEDTDELDSSFDDGQFVYSLGLGVRLGTGA
jgi:hypothetical protein